MVLEKFSEATILFSWGNEAERKVVVRLVSEIGGGARVIERLPIKSFTSLLKRVDLAVGGDTGPVHIAAAVGTPTVSFYRSSDARRSGPRGRNHVVVQSPLHCAKCFRTQCDKDADCRASIKPEALMTAICSLLS